AGRLDDDFGGTAVRQQSCACVVALRQPHLVEERIGLGRIVVGVSLRIFIAIERARGQHRVGAGLAESKKFGLIYLVPVDGERQSAPEAHITQDLAPHRILQGEIWKESDGASPAALPQLDSNRMRLLRLFQESIVGETDALCLEV